MIKPHDSIIVQHVSRFLIPFIHLFAVYVLTHGHYSPGGGFQAGVLIGASLILRLLIGTPKETGQFTLRRELLAATGGLFIYAGIGLSSFLTGSRYLDYAGVFYLGTKETVRRYYGILGIEIGVTLVVALTLVIIFHALAMSGQKKEVEL